MKQSITQQQWDELTAEQHAKYIEWTVKKSQETGDYTTVYRSIGHLIWFLNDHHATDNAWWDGGFISRQEVVEDRKTSINWCVYNAGKYHINCNAPDLVDALWDAVKVVLKEGKQS